MNKKNNSKSVTISFIGDIGLHDKYRELYKAGHKPFDEVSELLNKNDMVIGNLESICEGSEGESKFKNPRLKTDSETLNYLNQINAGAVSLAHNHVFDNLKDGFNNTIKFLTDNSIEYMGAGLTEEKSSQPLFKEIHGIKFMFANYISSDTNPSLPDDAEVYLNVFDKEKVIKEVQLHRERVDHIIVLLHWGGKVEEGIYPDYDQPKIAAELIDAGVDLIFGHHTHTLQPYEIYKGKYIFYSLGNFCFTDVVTSDRIRKSDTKHGFESIVVQVNFTKDNFSVNLHPIVNKSYKILFNKKVLSKLKRRNFIFQKFLKNNKLIWNIYYWQHKKIRPIIFHLFRKNKSIRELAESFNVRKFVKYILKMFRL